MVFVAPARPEDKPPSCMAQAFESKFSGGEVNAFFSKCSEQVKIRCEEAGRKLSGIEKMRAEKKCLKDGVGQ